MEYSSELRDPQVIVPHSDWRGSYDRGTTIVGSCVVYSSSGKMLAPPPDSTPSSGDQYGGVVGGGTYEGTKEHCLDVDWPAAYTWSARQYRRGYSGPDSWMGSLVFESRDASGLYYRRNRYYDSEKGRFTQEDPIGLAGGLNVYGFANGDPVNYSDPYGLSAECPPCAAAYAAFEIGSTIYDVGDLAVTAVQYARGKASGAELSVTAAGVGAGVVAFGGGYGRASRAALGASEARLARLMAAGQGARSMGFAAARRVNIDMAHILARHTIGGAEVTAAKTLFNPNWSARTIESAVRAAYRSGEVVRVQGERVLMQGTVHGETIQLWYNRTSRTIETAFTVFP